MGKTSIFTTIILLVIFSLLLSSCNFPGMVGVSTDPNADQTAIAQTVVVLQTQLAVDSTPVIPVVVPTLAELPIATQNPTLAAPTVAPLPTATALPTYSISSAVVDVTYPDNTVVKSGTTFKKTWRLTNSGTGTWNSNFKLVFINGDAMSGPASKAIGQAVSPGQSVDVSVDLTAPATIKTYQGNWMLQTDSGVNFGIGTNANSAFWVKVKVEQIFAVTNAVPAVTPALYNGFCPYLPFSVTAAITSTGAGTVTYYFVTSIGNSTTYELVFDAAGTKTTASYSIGPTSDFTVQVYIDNPNHQLFPTVVTVPVTCT
ncbi:MAG: NBR1-Ig-like domain-containing protein [Chloroflexi bacterium]|nr:NBR1-Ig-like domain-containing protein [Chloroflexota bacterium]